MTALARAGACTLRTVDSVLGRWTHAEWRPAGGSPLAACVASIWLFEGRVALLRERTFPAGHVELIAHLGPRYRAVDLAGGRAAPFPTTCVAGVQTGPVVVEAPAGALRVLGVRLRPAGAHAVLGCPLPELTGRTVELGAVLGPAADALAERCADAPTAAACLARAAAWVEARLARARSDAPHAAIAHVAAALEQAHGVASITRLRESVGLGRTRFAELFRAQVGLGAKQYGRVLRFRRALALLHAARVGATPRAGAARGGGASLSALALAAGYYDHAHLDADFRAFAGMTPTAFAAALRYDGGPSLAEPA